MWNLRWLLGAFATGIVSLLLVVRFVSAQREEASRWADSEQRKPSPHVVMRQRPGRAEDAAIFGLPAAPMVQAGETPIDFRVDPAIPYAVPTGPHYAYPDDVVTGDVSGDGLTDIVMTTVGADYYAPDYNVVIFVQRPDGTLSPPEFVSYLDMPYRTGLDLVDLNQDGLKEIVVGRNDGLTVIKRTNGAFSPISVPGPDLLLEHLAILDVNRDGHPDVFAQSGQNGAVIFFGDGRDGFSGSQLLPTKPFGYNSIEVSDVTGDGFDDLVLTNGQGFSVVWVYPIDRVTGLQPPREYDLGTLLRFPPFGATVADFDKDGIADFAVADKGDGVSSVKGVRLLYQDASRMISRTSVLLSAQNVGAIVAADLDGNGLLDIVTMQNSWNKMQYHLQLPDGFQPAVALWTNVGYTFNAHYFDNSLAVNDVNSDGCPDIVVADPNFGLLIYPVRNCRLRPPPPMVK